MVGSAYALLAAFALAWALGQASVGGAQAPDAARVEATQRGEGEDARRADDRAAPDRPAAARERLAAVGAPPPAGIVGRVATVTSTCDARVAPPRLLDHVPSFRAGRDANAPRGPPNLA